MIGPSLLGINDPSVFDITEFRTELLNHYFQANVVEILVGHAASSETILVDEAGNDLILK